MDVDIALVDGMEGPGYVQHVEKESIHCQLDRCAWCCHSTGVSYNHTRSNYMAAAIIILCATFQSRTAIIIQLHALCQVASTHQVPA